MCYVNFLQWVMERCTHFYPVLEQIIFTFLKFQKSSKFKNFKKCYFHWVRLEKFVTKWNINSKKLLLNFEQSIWT